MPTYKISARYIEYYEIEIDAENEIDANKQVEMGWSDIVYDKEPVDREVEIDDIHLAEEGIE